MDFSAQIFSFVTKSSRMVGSYLTSASYASQISYSSFVAQMRQPWILGSLYCFPAVFLL